MTEQIYPQLNDDYKVNFILDQQKLLKEKLDRYKKIKNKWTFANTTLKVCGIAVSCTLAGASILTVAPFAIPVAAAILGGISLANASISTLAVEGFTSKRKRYFRRKGDRVKEYLNKLELLFVKCKEDGQISPAEFEQVQKLMRDFENNASANQVGIKKKEINKLERQVKKDLKKQRLDQLYNTILQEQQQKLN